MYLTQGLHRSVQQRPDDVSTIAITAGGTRVRTYAETAERVSRLAGALRALGVGPGDRVAVLALNGDRYHEYLLAVPWADAVLNPINVRWSPAEIAYGLEHSGTRVLFVDDTFAAMLPALRDLRPDLDAVVHTGDGPTPEGALSVEVLIAEATPIEDARRGGDALAGLFYTGGTTGHPKGVMLTHTNLMTSALGLMASGYGFAPGATYLHAAPMFHLADLAAWNSVTAAGGRHVTVPMFDPVAVMTAVAEHAVTDLLLVPTMIQAVVDHPAVAEHDLTSLRALVYGASPISQAVLERGMKTFPNAAFTQAYGMTELSPVATLLGPEEHRRGDLTRSAGRAAPHTEVRVVDEDDREVPRGTVGEIVSRGGHVMAGYWDAPEESAAALRGGWMHTGDGGYMDDAGYVYVVDRIKDMIITGGENVYSAEVENALASHPGVAACAVIGLPDEQWGERVHAVVVPAAGHAPDTDALRAHVKELIAGYKAPRSVELVDTLPVSGAGKVLKRELRRRHWDDAERQVH